jgi:antitoxin component of MazEF toxin-antitoxin module
LKDYLDDEHPMIAIPSQIVKDLKLKAGDDMLLDIIDSTISVKMERR